jgi:wyosine [tRNA(Phe)-imidazoG37] synthetase (radical SAM superfamily)
VDEAVWRNINRPHEALELSKVLSGIERFASEFNGTLVSETMLLAGINDREELLQANTDFLQRLSLACSYLAVPTRPTTDPAAHAPDEAAITRAYARYAEVLPQVELLIGYEGDAFASSGDVKADLLSISAVHPLRESAVRELLKRNNADWDAVQSLVDGGELKQVNYAGEVFYARSRINVGHA